MPTASPIFHVRTRNMARGSGSSIQSLWEAEDATFMSWELLGREILLVGIVSERCHIARGSKEGYFFTFLRSDTILHCENSGVYILFILQTFFRVPWNS